MQARFMKEESDGQKKRVEQSIQTGAVKNPPADAPRLSGVFPIVCFCFPSAQDVGTLPDRRLSCSTFREVSFPSR